MHGVYAKNEKFENCSYLYICVETFIAAFFRDLSSRQEICSF